MARINTRPDIIYVKDMSEEDKDNFEYILKCFRTTNNGDAVKKLFREFREQQKTIQEKSSTIYSLEIALEKAEEERMAFLKNKDKLISAFTKIEDTLKTTKKDLQKIK